MVIICPYIEIHKKTLFEMDLMDLNCERKAFCAMSPTQYDSFRVGVTMGYMIVSAKIWSSDKQNWSNIFQMWVGYIYVAISISLFYPFVHLNYFVVRFPKNTCSYNNCEEMWNSVISSHNPFSTTKCWPDNLMGLPRNCWKEFCAIPIMYRWISNIILVY